MCELISFWFRAFIVCSLGFEHLFTAAQKVVFGSKFFVEQILCRAINPVLIKISCIIFKVIKSGYVELFSAVNLLNWKKYSSDVLITVLCSFPCYIDFRGACKMVLI